MRGARTSYTPNQNRIECNKLCGRQSHRTTIENWEGKCIMFKIAERWIPCFIRFVRMQLMAGRRTTIVNSFWVQIKSKIEREREKAEYVDETIPFDGCLICGKWIRNEIISGGSLECVREQCLRQWKCHLLAIWISLISSLFIVKLFSFEKLRSEFIWFLLLRYRTEPNLRNVVS